MLGSWHYFQPTTLVKVNVPHGSIVNYDNLSIESILFSQPERITQKQGKRILESSLESLGASSHEIHILSKIADLESKYDPYATNPKSTASGILQYLDSTWYNDCVGNKESIYDQAKCGLATYRRSGTEPWSVRDML